MSEPRQVETLDELRQLVGKRVYASTGGLDPEDMDEFDDAHGPLLSVDDDGWFTVLDEEFGWSAPFSFRRSYVIEASDE